MALIAMAVFDTDENQRTDLTRRTLLSLKRTVNFTRHRLFVSDNGSCQATQDMYADMIHEVPFTLIQSSTNEGTAVAINKAWIHREPGEHCVKMDNDVEIWEEDWADQMETVFAKLPDVGICGLKRKDVWEFPEHPDSTLRSELFMAPHEPGERWLVLEQVNHVMGTLQGYSSNFLDKIGFLYQMQDMGNLYGFDDSLAACRAKKLDYRSVFLPSIPIDHIDPGTTYYTEWKKLQAHEWMHRYLKVRAEYMSGARDVYYDGP